MSNFSGACHRCWLRWLNNNLLPLKTFITLYDNNTGTSLWMIFNRVIFYHKKNI